MSHLINPVPAASELFARNPESIGRSSPDVARLPYALLRQKGPQRPASLRRRREVIEMAAGGSLPSPWFVPFAGVAPAGIPLPAPSTTFVMRLCLLEGRGV